MANRKIRDTVFCRYIGTKPHLLELANALKGTQYTDSSMVNINTLEGSFYSNLKNDISFILDNIIVVLIEHQTTINPNMPLRFLSYVDEIYRMQTQSQQRKIYGKNSSSCLHLSSMYFMTERTAPLTTKRSDSAMPFLHRLTNWN